MPRPRFITDDYPQEKAAIREMLDELRASLSSLDLDRIEAHHLYGPKFTRLENGVLMESEAGRQVERDGFGAMERFDSDFENVRIDVFEHTALVTCVYRGEFVVGGETSLFAVSLTFVLVNDGGRWRIVHEALFNLQGEPGLPVE